MSPNSHTDPENPVEKPPEAPLHFVMQAETVVYEGVFLKSASEEKSSGIGE